MDAGGFVIVVNADKVSDWEKTHPEALPSSFRSTGSMKMETFAHHRKRVYQEQLLNRQSRVCCQKKIAWGGNCSPSKRILY